MTIRKSVLDHVGPFDESLRATIDYEMWLRVAAHGHTAVEAPGPLAVYRSGRSGSISSNRERVLSNMLRVYEIAIEKHPGSEQARELARARHAFVAHELGAVRGGRSVDALRRRGRDSLARARSRLRTDRVWYPLDAPPSALVSALPDLFG